MIILIFIPSFLIFLYILYKLAKDDHVFLRKNIKLEHFFDYAFIVIITGLIAEQFSTNHNISLLLLVVGGSISLFLVGKYNNFPIGRMFDYFALSFLGSLPSVFFLEIFFTSGVERFVSLTKAFVYLFFAIFFFKILFPKMMSRTAKDGSISIAFFLVFSCISLLTALFNILYKKQELISVENFVFAILFLLSVIALLFQSIRRVRR